MRRVLGSLLATGALLVIAPTARADSGTVTLQDNQYSPNEIVVSLGESVTWTDQGSNPHSVTSDPDGGVFDSSPDCGGLADPLDQQCMTKGSQFTVTFDTAGRFAYHCRVHGNAMTGTVIVESASTSTASSVTTTTTSAATTTVTTTTSTSSDGDQSTVSQGPAPTFTSTSRVAAAQPIADASGPNGDDLTPWVLADVAIAGATTITGVVLVRRGRVPFG